MLKNKKAIHFVGWFSCVKQEQVIRKRASGRKEAFVLVAILFFKSEREIVLRIFPSFLFSSVTTWFLVDLVEIFWMLSNLFWSLWLEVKAHRVKNCSLLWNERSLFILSFFFNGAPQFSWPVSTLWSFYNIALAAYSSCF